MAVYLGPGWLGLASHSAKNGVVAGVLPPLTQKSPATSFFLQYFIFFSPESDENLCFKYFWKGLAFYSM